VTGDGAGATFLRGNAVDVPGQGYANGDELQIEGGNGEKVKVTSTILQLTDDAAVSGTGHAVAEQLTLADETGWEDPPVIEITSVDDVGRATGIEKRSGGVYTGELPIAKLFFERVEQPEARVSGSGSGTDGTDGSALELSANAVLQQAQAVQQQQQQQEEEVSPVLAAAAACGFVVVVLPAVAAMVSWRRRFTKSAAQQVSTPCAATLGI
jgi:hypothetical protein